MLAERKLIYKTPSFKTFPGEFCSFFHSPSRSPLDRLFFSWSRISAQGRWSPGHLCIFVYIFHASFDRIRCQNCVKQRYICMYENVYKGAVMKLSYKFFFDLNIFLPHSQSYKKDQNTPSLSDFMKKAKSFGSVIMFYWCRGGIIRILQTKKKI